MKMNRFLGLALLAAGVVLIIFGINASESFSSDVSRFFTGSPTNKSVWMLVSGIFAAIVGLFLTLSGARNR
jgi:drug/metabolite transporter (DMT)-like permease